ncbi:DegT/DnrJ/EryC1/StrS family aminotransferase [Paludisphaera rhizosphaerae]|uniref:DegT/DnrJ/EryC1/StrS family aminotransferase n=1 Tax=Paludisphaera rhizosphaerae TaxID=2711216 RepID=UPI0013EE03E1|nr:DegT/DnrJ/EryC1/StrS family aminotransferase [Paludisphaera rhizosphaerae]
MAVPYEPTGVPALNLRAQYRTIRDEIEPVVREVLETQGFVMGPEVSSLESEIAEYCGAAHAVGCASGTDALLLPLMAIDLGAGDEVITSPYTFFATGGSIWRTGARPVFVDIEPDTFNIDPAKIEAAITPRTKAIIPVHLYGQAADMNPIREIAERHNLMVLEDAAQAIGAAYEGRRTGTLGTVAAFSFYPSKNLGGFGDGGMVATDDPVLARRIARLRVHGMEPKYHHHEVGLNSRLDALQAAVLRVKLRHLDEWTTARREVADRYRSLFAAHGLEEMVGLPIERPGNYHVYNQFVVRVPATIRDEMRQRMSDRKIGTEIYYPIPLHLQPCFASLGHKHGDFPQTEAAARETIALPIYPELTESEQRLVVGTMQQFLHERAYPSLFSDRAA